MSTYAIYADHFVLAGALMGKGYLLINDETFGRYMTDKPSCEIKDYSGCWVAPGLVDTHIHGFYNHATTDQDAEGINISSRELALRGTTAWLPTTFTESVEHVGAACKAIAKAVELRDENYQGARIPGIFLEGPFFTIKHVGAQNPKFLIEPEESIFDAWQELAGGLIKKTALAAEKEHALDYIEAVTEKGAVACIAHSDATYDQTLAAINSGATCFVHTYNGMRGLHHRDPGIVGCAMKTQSTYAELICDGLHVSPAACEVLVRAKGWDHVALITDCLGCGGMPEGEYMSGGLPVVMRDGACYLRDGSSLAGSVLTLVQGVKNMVDWGIVTPEQSLRMATEVAARSSKVDDQVGLIKPGRLADFIVLNEDLTLVDTYMSGEKLEAK